jgi:hypothetical protein
MHKVPRGKRESTLVDSFLKYDLVLVVDLIV